MNSLLQKLSHFLTVVVFHQQRLMRAILNKAASASTKQSKFQMMMQQERKHLGIMQLSHPPRETVQAWATVLSKEGTVSMKLMQQPASRKCLTLTTIWTTWMSIGTFIFKTRPCLLRSIELQTIVMTWWWKISRLRAFMIRTSTDFRARDTAQAVRNTTEGVQTISRDSTSVLIKSAKSSMAQKGPLIFT